MADKKEPNLNFIKTYQIIAIVIAAIVIFIYMVFIIKKGFTVVNIGDGGVIGDYFGGMLNPAFAFLGLLALLQTIKLQSSELSKSSEALENSKEELRLTREETTKTRQIFEEQEQTIKIQRFENTFFNMLPLYKDSVESIHHSKNIPSMSGGSLLSFDTRTYEGKECIDFLTNGLINNLSKRDEGESDIEIYTLSFYKKYSNKFGHYFRNVYHILKFIQSIDGENQKFYANILRAQLSQNELKLLFLNCASIHGEEKFLPIAVEFELFEPLEVNDYFSDKTIMKFAQVGTINFEDLYKAFGDNDEWKDKIDSILQKGISPDPFSYSIYLSIDCQV